MRFYRYINEDVIKRALEIEEPEVGEKYIKDEVKEYINIIKKALEEIKRDKNKEAKLSIEKDLLDKKKKWENVDKETKPVEKLSSDAEKQIEVVKAQGEVQSRLEKEKAKNTKQNK